MRTMRILMLLVEGLIQVYRELNDNYAGTLKG